MALTDKIGIAREAIITEPTWPSVSAALVTELLPVTSLEIRSGINQAFTPSTDTDGQRFGYVDADVTNNTPSFTLGTELRYYGLEQLFVNALGMEARYIDDVQMPEELVAGKAYRHVFEVDQTLGTGMPWSLTNDGIMSGDIVANQRKVRRATLVAQRDTFTWQCLSSMVNQLSLGFNENMEGRCNTVWYGYSLDRASMINTTATLRKALLNAAPHVIFLHTIIRIAPYSASVPLDSDDQIALTAWSVTLENNLQIQQGPRTTFSSEEFERGGPPTLLGSFNLPRYTNNIFVEAWPASTSFMMDMKATGPLIPGTNVHYQLNVYIPGLRIIQAEPSGPDVKRSNLPLQWYAVIPAVRPAGFPSGVKNGPIIIELVNHIARHSLL